MKALAVDGNRKSGINSPVEGKVVYLPLFTTTRGGYHDCQTVTVTIWWLQRLLSVYDHDRVLGVHPNGRWEWDFGRHQH